MTRKLAVGLSLAALAFFSFIATAAAAGTAVPEDGALLDLARPVFDAIMHGQWWLAASLALILVVAAIKKYAPGKFGAWAHSDLGGSILVLGASFGGAAATGLLAAGTGAMSLALAWTALKVALAASGGYSLLKKLVMPYVRKLGDKAPAWMKPIFSMLLWAFDSNAQVVAAAEQAGNDAVAANPPTGADGVAGTPTDL
jgi:hypothetical protein